MKQTENIIALKISGLNIHHVISYFEKEGFSLTNLNRIDEHNLEVHLKEKDYKKFKKSPLYKTFKVKKQLFSGSKLLLEKFIKNIGLFIGITCALLISINFTNKVLSVDITAPNHTCENGESCIFKGDNLLKLKEKLNFLGVTKFALISNLPNNQTVEKELVKEFKQISGVKMRVQGVHVKIDIIEAKLPATETSSALVSEVSGIVISTFVSSGKLKVKNGDMVLKGEELVEPENDLPIRASITIRTFYHEATIYDENQITYRRTGKKVTRNSLEFMSLSAPAKGCDFNLYETTIRSSYVFYNLFIPLKVTETTYYELEKIENKVPFSEAEKSVKEKLLSSARLLLPPNAEEKNATFTTLVEGSRTRIDCYIETYLTIEK